MVRSPSLRAEAATICPGPGMERLNRAALAVPNASFFIVFPLGVADISAM